MRKPTALLVLCFLYGCSDCSDEKHTVLEPKVTTFTLKVYVGKGVEGSPRAGTYEYKEGEQAAYSYRTVSGYEDLIVEVGGVLAQPVGSVVMNGDKEIAVIADSVRNLPQGAEPGRSAVTTFLSSSAPSSILSAYEAQLKVVEQLYLLHNAVEAKDLALAAYSAAYNRASDTEIERAEKSLSGRLFGKTGEVKTVAEDIASSSTGSREISLIFVNGLMNSMDAAAVSRIELERLMLESSISSRVEVLNFYNASAWHDQDKNRRCIRRAIERHNGVDFFHCQVWSYLGDWLQASRQIAEIYNVMPLESEKEAGVLAEIVRKKRKEDKIVILVGHSQGTLMVTQAMKELGAENSCVGAVSLAGPHGRSAWTTFNDEGIFGLAIAGKKSKDIILALGLNDFEQIATDLTNAADRRIEETFKQLANTTVKVHLFDRIMEDVRLHNFIGSYLAGDRSRIAIRDAIVKVAQTLDVRTNCVRPAGLRIYATSANAFGGFTSGPSKLWIVPPYEYGVDTLVSVMKTSNGENVVFTDIARSPKGEFWGVTFNKLYLIDEATGVAKEKFSFTEVYEVNALAFNSSGKLYVADHDGTLLALDLTGVTPRVVWTGKFGSSIYSAGDLAFHPDGRLFAVGQDEDEKSMLVNVDLSSGAVSRIGNSVFKTRSIWGLAFVGEQLFGLSAEPGERYGFLLKIDVKNGEDSVMRKLDFKVFGASSRSLRSLDK